MNELLRALELFLKCGASPGIRVSFDLASDIPACLIEPSQFNAALINLVVNARDAMPEGGEIHISTERWEVKQGAQSPSPGMYVRLGVQDSGHGMSANVLRKILGGSFTTKGDRVNWPRSTAGVCVHAHDRWSCGSDE